MEDSMYIANIKLVIRLLVLSIAGLTLTSHAGAQTGGDIQPPELPAACGALQPDAGEEVVFRTYAIGVQIYRWNGASWDLVAPSASLYADDGYHGRVGTHYGGPTWESNSGSRVVGRRAGDCTPDATAIPWLKLEALSTDGPGIFNNVKHIQRVNTTGGLKPATAGSIVGEERRIPYTAEYYFYKTVE